MDSVFGHNITSAFTFGFLRKNAHGVLCITEEKLVGRGIWSGDNPLKFVGPVFLLQLIVGSFLTTACQFLLKPLGQTTFVGRIMAGIISGPSIIGQIKAFKETIFPPRSRYVLDTLSTFGCMFYLFLVGVRMDISMVRRSGKKEWAIGLSTFFLPLIFTVPISFVLKSFFSMDKILETKLPMVAVLKSLSSFHVIACLLTDLKLLNSELGRLAMSSSMISGLLSWITMGVALSVKQALKTGGGAPVCIKLLTSAAATVCLIAYAIRPLMTWMVRHTEEGKPIRQGYFSTIFLIILGCSLLSEILGQHAIFAPMVLGLFVPDGLPLGSGLVDKLDLFVSAILLPLYFVVNGGRVQVNLIKPTTYIIVELTALLATMGKFIGTMLACLFIRMPLRDSVTLGLILCTVGILDIQFYSSALQLGYIDILSFSVMCISVMLLSGFITPIVKALYDPSRRYVGYTRRTIQHTKRNAEIRVLVCVHNQESVPTIINPTRESPIGVYLLQLVELVGRASPLFVAHEPGEKASSRPTRSECIVNAFRIYERNNHSIVTVQPFTSIAPYATMHEDICTLALDKNTSIVILPFHKQWTIDGVVESASHRNVNNNVLARAPCSVGVLVDRGAFSGSKSILESWHLYRIGVIFLGGADNREALAYAMRMSEQPNVNLTAVHLCVVEGRTTDNLLEKKLDGDLISAFRLGSAGSDRVHYREESISDGVGIVTVVQSMEGSYDLVLVGRHHEKDSAIFVGLTEWNEFPELRFIGDMLASSDIKGRLSVLVVQQQAYAGEVHAYSRKFHQVHIKLDESEELVDKPHKKDVELSTVDKLDAEKSRVRTLVYTKNILVQQQNIPM